MAILGLRITAGLAVLLGFLKFNPVGGQWASKPVVSTISIGDQWAKPVVYTLSTYPQPGQAQSSWRLRCHLITDF